MKRIVAGFAIALMLCCFSGIAAPDSEGRNGPEAKDQQSKFEAETNLIEVRAIVTDEKGRIVEGLNKDDFVLLENGRAQEITHFDVSKIDSGHGGPVRGGEELHNKEAKLREARERLSRTPVRSILLYVDSLHLSFTSLNWVKRTLRRFIEEQLTDQDLVAFASSETLGVSQQFTRDRRILRYAVEQMQYSPVRRQSKITPDMAAKVLLGQPHAIQQAIDIVREEDNVLCPCSLLQTFSRYKASRILEDAYYSSRNTLSIIEQYAEQMRDLPGKRMIVVFSDGFTSYNASGVTQLDEIQNAVSRAARSGVAIYSIDARGLQGPPGIDVTSRFNMVDGNYEALTQCMNGCQDPLEQDANVIISCMWDCYNQYPSPLVCKEDILYLSLSSACNPPNPGDLDRYFSESEAEMMKGLHTIADDTGGRLLDKMNDLNIALGQALDDNRFFYVLSYYMPEGGAADRFRHIEVRVRNHPEYKVRAPRGFWPGRIKATPEAESEQTPQQRLIRAMMFPLPATDLGVSARADYLETEADDKQVSLDVYFEGDRFDYRDQGQSKDVNLEILYLIYDSSGKQVDGISARAEAHLTQQGMKRAQSGGYRFSRRVALKPGVYQVRAGVREEGTDRLGTATTWLEVPQSKPGALEMSSLILSNPLDMDLETAEGIDVNGLEQIKMVQGIPMYSQDDIFYYTYRVRRGGDDVSDAGLLLKRELLQGGEPVETDDWIPAAALDVSDGKGWSDYDGELDISELDPGAYELRISLKEGPSGKVISRSIAFGIL